ncbi:MAG: OadG family protein [Lachnospiraceae bacterium]|nr:OadG family protein [Lachnospiraceae bacterium]
MKKFMKTLFMLTCVLGLTACGTEKELTDFEQSKVSMAEYQADGVVGAFISIVESGTADSMLENYNNVELSKLFDDSMTSMLSQYTGTSMTFSSEGTVVRNAINSFTSGIENMGGISDLGTVTSVLDKDTITVTVPVTGNSKNGSVELIFTNDIFLTLTSCTLNLDESLGTLMGRAGLNTLLGMGTVFVVLILISFIISAFNLIPKMQAKFAKNNEPEIVPVPAAPAPVVEEVEEDLTDDMELVAVIAAAIAAYEGTTTEGFQVRSIKRASTRKWQKA